MVPLNGASARFPAGLCSAPPSSVFISITIAHARNGRISFWIAPVTRASCSSTYTFTSLRIRIPADKFPARSKNRCAARFCGHLASRGRPYSRRCRGLPVRCCARCDARNISRSPLFGSSPAPRDPLPSRESSRPAATDSLHELDRAIPRLPHDLENFRVSIRNTIAQIAHPGDVVIDAPGPLRFSPNIEQQQIARANRSGAVRLGLVVRVAVVRLDGGDGRLGGYQAIRPKSVQHPLLQFKFGDRLALAHGRRRLLERTRVIRSIDLRPASR